MSKTEKIRQKETILKAGPIFVYIISLMYLLCACCLVILAMRLNKAGGGNVSLQLIKMHNSICSHISGQVSHKTQGSTSSAEQHCRIKNITVIKLMKKTKRCTAERSV